MATVPPASPEPTPSAPVRLAVMQALLQQWERELCRYPYGTLELHFAPDRVKAVLRLTASLHVPLTPDPPPAA